VKIFADTSKVDEIREFVSWGVIDGVTTNPKIIASGGTALAACSLVERLGGKVVECAFVIDLPSLGGRMKLGKEGYKVFDITKFKGN